MWTAKWSDAMSGGVAFVVVSVPTKVVDVFLYRAIFRSAALAALTGDQREEIVRAIRAYELEELCPPESNRTEAEWRDGWLILHLTPYYGAFQLRDRMDTLERVLEVVNKILGIHQIAGFVMPRNPYA